MRPPDEIARLLKLRAERALAHLAALAEHGPARLCPICGYEGPFSPVRHKPGIWCPGCDSRPRHRLLKLWFEREAILFPGARLLHFAPEPWVRHWLPPDVSYTTADPEMPADLALDMEAIGLDDGVVDMVIANHVLEHVDDARALPELRRILSPGGVLVLTVPLVEGWEATHEVPGLTAEERRIQYGDPLHRRFYGRDVRARICAAGFALAEFTATEPDVSRHGLHRGEKVFVARAA